ncbi:transglycosylase SLT domain-containing protein [Pseudomaricurvus sp. HS19]|uniref:transglycosylase SLT domain-containing protein n=1 Tax=Pseudomaricurvus sp. HS19 TaxID=2692626 RepID=UPI00136D9F37|nr:transglycosylase SLT domain-containing protein [Pseudomaricurvus sp. HS19]MYM62118.1 transglycosylase SLT domain-containing protein [Pseudomaricurvus sp. HS19]
MPLRPELLSPLQRLRPNLQPVISSLRLLICTTLLATPLAQAGNLLPAADDSHDLLNSQRQIYLEAREAQRHGQRQKYRQLRERLHGYPLTAYLDYYDLRRQLSRLPSEEVGEFLAQQDNSYLADRLRRAWLDQLAERELWQDYIAFYRPEVANTALQCRWIQARHLTGDSTALAETAPLWNVDYSQPKDCDPLFSLWTNAGYRTQEIVWERFNKALQGRSSQLARYLARQLEGENQQLAELHLEVDRHPQRILQQQQFQPQNQAMQSIILHGVQRLAHRDPVKALNQWGLYDAQQLFDDQPRRETQELLAIELVKDGYTREADSLLQQIPGFSNLQVTEFLIRDSLKQQDWQKVYQYIRQLPDDEQSSERWLYWRARALETLGEQDGDLMRPQDIYTQLALERSFYGFMAADHIGNQYRLGDVPATAAPELLLRIASEPASQRARELRAVGDITNASREWLDLSSRFTSEEEHIAAAQLANQWGWHHKSITSLATARYWDDLRLRFPLAHQQPIFKAADDNQVSPLLLYAITRQESAFAEHARSPAGAMGLMQLMPATAQETARKAGLPYSKSDLMVPDKNISLGSFYITEMLQRYQGNRFLAAAAYNAGPHRVDRWLRNSASALPADVWIETIPFRETRRYVQNVLAYSVIYGYRTGTTPTMLNPVEHDQNF